MEVSSSGYYAWRHRPESERSVRNADLLIQIQATYKASHETYGSPRIYVELLAQGIRSGLNRVARLMRVAGIQARKKRRFVVTTDSKHHLPVAPNVLDRQFIVAAPNERWVSDITYIWTMEGWLYLAVVLDLFNRQVVGWSTDSTIDQLLVSRALSKALHMRGPSTGLLLHSDRGSQYASRAYQEQLGQASIVCSMSRKGNCWDNAVVESFFSTLKTELIGDYVYHTRAEARSNIFEYIEIWYNRQRRHSSLGYLSPTEFEQKAVAVG
jgi:transposase InsO family protein